MIDGKPLATADTNKQVSGSRCCRQRRHTKLNKHTYIYVLCFMKLCIALLDWDDVLGFSC